VITILKALKPFIILLFFLLFGLTVVGQPSNIDIEVSDRLIIEDYDFSDSNNATIYFYAESAGRFDVFDVNSFEETGSSNINIETFSAQSGNFSITMDVTNKRGDRTLAIIDNSQGATISNDRTSELIGEADGLQFVIGSLSGGIAVIMLVIYHLKKRGSKYSLRKARPDIK